MRWRGGLQWRRWDAGWGDEGDQDLRAEEEQPWPSRPDGRSSWLTFSLPLSLPCLHPWAQRYCLRGHLGSHVGVQVPQRPVEKMGLPSTGGSQRAGLFGRIQTTKRSSLSVS